MCGAPPTSLPDFDVPDWFPWTAEDSDKSGQETSIPVEDSLMNQLLAAKQISELYGEFFGKLFEKGRLAGKVSGRLRYSTLTPHWLRVPVAFLYGSSQTKLITFLHCELPRKSFVREKPNKALACAILATWYHRETSSKELLRQMLHDKGVSLSDSNLP